MLNPTEQFVVISLQRSQMADCLNDVINEQRLTVPRFTHGDNRLTSDICHEIADVWGDLMNADMGDEDLGAEQHNAMHDILKKYFGC